MIRVVPVTVMHLNKRFHYLAMARRVLQLNIFEHLALAKNFRYCVLVIENLMVSLSHCKNLHRYFHDLETFNLFTTDSVQNPFLLMSFWLTVEMKSNMTTQIIFLSKLAPCQEILLHFTDFHGQPVVLQQDLCSTWKFVPGVHSPYQETLSHLNKFHRQSVAFLENFRSIFK